MNILFSEVETIDKDLVLKQFHSANIVSMPITTPNDVEQYKETEILCCFIYSVLSKPVLDALPNLRLICTRSVGYDHIDLPECERRGITVCNVPDYGSHVIAEHVFALLLSKIRNITEADARTESGNFSFAGLRGIALKEKTIGIIGTGKIGRRVAQIAHGFGMHILAVDQCRTIALEEDLGVEYTDLSDALGRSDILTLHIPAMPETEHVLNAATLQKVKPGCIIINTARGSLIDSDALLQALNNNTVKFALLDVLEHEQNFLKNKSLIEHPNVVVTPHIGFYADESMQNMYNDCFATIQQWLEHTTPDHIIKPINIVCNLPPIRV